MKVWNGCNILTVGKARYIQYPHGEGGENYYGLLNAEVYCLRIYGRNLTDKEVLENYEKTKNFHSLLVNDK